MQALSLKRMLKTHLKENRRLLERRAASLLLCV